jgi:hypothetical protein
MGPSGEETSIFRRESQACPSISPSSIHSPSWSGSSTRPHRYQQVSNPVHGYTEDVTLENFVLFKIYISKCQTEQAISCLLPVKWIIYHSSFCNPFFLVFFPPPEIEKILCDNFFWKKIQYGLGWSRYLFK